MRPDRLTWTDHANWRMQQGNLSEEDILFVCMYGVYEYGAGAICYFLGKRRISTLGQTLAKKYARLEGVTILCCSRCKCVLTMYHNQHGLKDHRHKHKYNRKSNACPFCKHIPRIDM